MRLAFASLVLSVLVAAGCSNGSEPPAQAAAPTKQPAKDETGDGRDIDWLLRLHRWELKFERHALTTTSLFEEGRAGTSSSRELRRALRKIARCERELRQKVGEPDATRYRPGFELLVKGCKSRAGAARSVIEAMAEDEPLRAGYLRRESARGDTFFEQASYDIEAALRANRSLPLVAKKSTRSRIDRRLSRAIGELLWREPSGPEVRCWSPREWPYVEKEWAAYVGRGDLLGFLHHTTLNRASLAPEPCAQLAAFVYDRARPSSGSRLLKMALAVGVLAHEAEHVRDSWASEAVTECNAMQHLRWLARIMGASRSYASLLAETYWRDIYPTNTAEYRTPACHDRGALDQQPGSSVWP